MLKKGKDKLLPGQDVMSPPLPNWKVKVKKRLASAETGPLYTPLRTDFPDPRFPIKPFQVASNTSKVECAKILQKAKESLAELDKPLPPGEMTSHFKMYSNLMKCLTLDKEFKMGRQGLEKLLQATAESTLLLPQARLAKFDHLLSLYILEGHRLNIDIMRSYAKVASIKLFSLEDYQNFLKELAEKWKMDQEDVKRLQFVKESAIAGLVMNGACFDALKVYNSITSTNSRHEASTFIVEGSVSKFSESDTITIVKRATSVYTGPWLAYQYFDGLLNGKDPNIVKFEVLRVLADCEKEKWPMSFGIYSKVLLLSKIFGLDELKVLVEVRAPEIGLDFTQMDWESNVQLLLYRDDVVGANKLFSSGQTIPSTFITHELLNAFVMAIARKLKNDKLGLSNKERGMLLALISVYFSRLREARLHINQNSCSAMLECFAMFGNADRCEAVINNMNRRSSRPSAEQYYHLMDAHCRNGSINNAKTAVEEMIKLKIKPDTRIFNRLIQGYLEQDDCNYDKAFNLLDQMPKLFIQTDEETSQLFLKAFSVEKNKKKGILARERFNHWMESVQDGSSDGK